MEQYGRVEFNLPLSDPSIEMDNSEAEYAQNWQDEWA